MVVGGIGRGAYIRHFSHSGIREAEGFFDAVFGFALSFGQPYETLSVTTDASTVVS